MKSLCLAAGLVLFLWPAAGAEPPEAKAPPPATAPAAEGEAPLRDPFAVESNPAKEAPRIKDPFKGMNQAFFKFNDKLYFWVLKPAGTGYKTVVPRLARVCLGRFFANIRYPIHLVNHLLQGKFKSAGLETGRFVVNSTVGVAGLFDPAKSWKLASHPADFDQTLGFYGVPAGIYFDWPLLGPSSARGTVGIVADEALTPWTYSSHLPVSFGVPAFQELNGASLRLGEYEAFKKATLDPYAAMRSAYYESRAQAVERSKAKAAR